MPLTIFKQTHHAAGNAPDTTPFQIDLQPSALVLDLSIFDNSALVSFSSDGIFFSTEREFPAGVIASFNMLCQSIRIRNKTAASVARYDISAYYDAVEIEGKAFVPNIRTP